MKLHYSIFSCKHVTYAMLYSLPIVQEFSFLFKKWSSESRSH